jgi:hypothetical protein
MKATVASGDHGWQAYGLPVDGVMGLMVHRAILF